MQMLAGIVMVLVGSIGAVGGVWNWIDASSCAQFYICSRVGGFTDTLPGTLILIAGAVVGIGGGIALIARNL